LLREAFHKAYIYTTLNSYILTITGLGWAGKGNVCVYVFMCLWILKCTKLKKKPGKTRRMSNLILPGACACVLAGLVVLGSFQFKHKT
jgi:hypothetical protein